ncbi:MAG TPA: molybdenum cofactor guanylyltransferase [Gemmatimonadales bacterium]
MIAGGDATRYGGAPKGLLEVGGRRILDRVVDALHEATGQLPLLVANDPAAADWRPDLAVQADEEPGLGSLGGILTAVQRLGPCLCVAWDMPFVPAALLKELSGLLASADAVVPESGSRLGLEPLCAAYGPGCVPAIRRALARGDRRAAGFHDGITLTRLPLRSVLQYGEPEVIFFNVNSPADLSRAESLCRVPGSSR